jgi:hypothetical protein
MGMATEQSSGGIRLSTLYGFLSTVFASMFLVLLASNRADDNWFRLFMIVYLVAMQLFFVVMLFISRRSEKQTGPKPKAEPETAPDCGVIR